MATKRKIPTYFLNLRSVAENHSVIAKIFFIEAEKLNPKGPDGDALDIWNKFVRNLPLDTIEALERLIKRRVDNFYAAKSQAQVEKLAGKKHGRLK